MAGFIVRAMNARYFRTQVELAISGAEGLANNLPLSALKDLLVAIPPLDESMEISDRLDTQLQGIDTAIDRANREIDLLTEFRTRLTADVVTGKLDVREAAAELPEVDPLAADDEPDALEVEAETDLAELDAKTEEAEA